MAEQEARGVRPCLQGEDACRPDRAINGAVPDSPWSLWLGYEVNNKYRRNTIDLMTDSLQSLCLAVYKDRQDRVANSACDTSGYPRLRSRSSIESHQGDSPSPS